MDSMANEGLEKYKETVSKVGLDCILEETIRIHKEMPNVWPGNSGWNNIGWAFGNAWRKKYWETIDSNFGDIYSIFQLKDVLTNDQMKIIAEKCKLDITLYKSIEYTK